MSEQQTYRATLESWLGQLLLPLVFFTLMAITGVNHAGLNPWLAGFGMLLLAVVIFLEYMLPMLRNWLHLDARSIEGSLDGSSFMVYWTEVLAAWLIEKHRTKYLCIGTRDGTVVVPLRFFNDQAVWMHVRASVSPAALDPAAIQRLPDYQELLRAGELAAKEALEEAQDPTAGTRAVADHWLFQIAGWTGLALFLFGTMGNIRSGNWPAVIGLLLLSAVSGLLLINWGLTEFSPRNVLRHTLFTHTEMLWDDVRSIEIGPGDLVIVLTSDECRLVIPGPALWSGVGKKAALALLLSNAERRRIPLRRSFGAMFKTNRRSRSRR